MSPPLPPTDLMYLASSAESQGAECRIGDYSGDPKGMRKFLSVLKEFQPDLLVVSTTTPTLQDDLAACAAARRELPSLTIAAKGAHFLVLDREIMERWPCLDVIFRGEAEISLAEIVAGLKFEQVSGLTWKNGGEIVRNPDRPFNEDLDSLPFPARHLVDNVRFCRPDNGRPLGVVKVSRGCPHHCFFCLATPVFGSRVRRRSPANICEELQLCVERYGIQDFILWADVFNYDRQWVLDLCGSIMASGLKIRWSANVRADRVDRETAVNMRRAGCELVSVGVESGNQEMLDLMGKGETLQQIREAFIICRGAGLKTLGYFVFGLPWETEASAEDTIRFALELDSDYASFFVATPLPGTRFFTHVRDTGFLASDKTLSGEGFCNAYYAPVVSGQNMDQATIAELRRRAIRHYVFRPRYLAKRIAELRSLRQVVTSMRFGMALARESFGRKGRKLS